MSPLFSVIYFIGFITYVIVGYVFFYRGKDVALKRKWWPIYIGGLGVLMVGKFALYMLRASPAQPGQAPDYAGPVVFAVVIAFVIFRRLTRTKFCDKCAAMVRSRWATIKFCPKCGTELPGKK